MKLTSDATCQDRATWNVAIKRAMCVYWADVFWMMMWQAYRQLCCPLQWRHNGCDGFLNHQPHHCLLKRLFGRRSKQTSKLRVPGLCAWNSPVTGEFPAQMASNAENVSIWWRHHAKCLPNIKTIRKFCDIQARGFTTLRVKYFGISQFWNYEIKKNPTMNSVMWFCSCFCLLIEWVHQGQYYLSLMPLFADIKLC